MVWRRLFCAGRRRERSGVDSMAKRPSSRGQADDIGQAAQPGPTRARAKRPTPQQPQGAENRPARSEELPNIPEPGDAADQAERSEPAALEPRAVLDRVARSESMASEPTEEDIRLRAYHRYLERGGGHGAHFDDWLEAERELKK